MISACWLTLPGGCALLDHQRVAAGERQQFAELNPLLDLREELKDLFPEHAHLAGERVVGVELLFGLFEHSLVFKAVSWVGPVDEEKLAGPHIIGIDHGNVGDPVWRQDGLVRCEQLPTSLHEHLSVECNGASRLAFPEAFSSWRPMEGSG